MTKNSSPQTTVLCPQWVICVDAQDRVLSDHSVVVRNDKIIAICTRQLAFDDYPGAQVEYLPQHALMPGLINAHTHMAMSLMRGFADDLPLMTWLTEHIWPAEAQHASTAFVADGTRLAIAESLRGGVTCFNDMYFFPDVVADTALQSGIRASVGLIVLDFPTVWAKDANDYIAKGMELHNELKDSPTLSCMFAPHAPYTVSSEPLQQIAQLSHQHNIGVHMHVHETADETNQFQQQHNMRPLQRLADLGLLNEQFAAVHMTQLSEDEIELAASKQISVMHCPESNLKLASGIAPVAKMLEVGINVAVGTDGAASNNDLDMFGELRSAALLGKCAAADASALDANQVLRMGTINAAHAIGLSGKIGSIEVGKQADLTAVNFNRPELQPVFNPVAHLIYSANRYDVNHVWVAGQRRLKNGKLTTLDADEIVANAQHWGEKLKSSRASS